MAISEGSRVEPDTDLAFQARISIGKGWRTIDRNAQLTIAGGKLTLSTREGRLIVEAPVGEVYAEPMRFSAGSGAKITIGGEKYSLVPLALRTYNSAELAGATMRLGASSAMEFAGSALKLAGDVSKIKRGREMTFTLLRAIKKAGGHVSFG